MAVGLQTGVPWVMCKQQDAPDPVVSTYQLRLPVLVLVLRRNLTCLFENAFFVAPIHYGPFSLLVCIFI